MTLLIVTPLEAEFESLVATLADLRGEPRPDAATASALDELRSGVRAADRLTIANLDGGGIVAATGGLGKTQFGVQTTHLINALSADADRAPIRAVVCAGSSGGLAPDLSPGDVVVGVETVEHDFNNKGGMINLDLPRFPGDPVLLDKLRAAVAARSWDFAARFGGVASGDEGIDSRERADALRAATGADAVAWEGAGGARAAQFAGLPFLEIRGVSDAAGPTAMEDFLRNIPLAMGSVAKVVNELPALLD